MNNEPICPDCGAEFDPEKPLVFRGIVIVGFKVFQCPQCKHLIYQMVSADQDESEATPADEN